MDGRTFTVDINTSLVNNLNSPLTTATDAPVAVFKMPKCAMMEQDEPPAKRFKYNLRCNSTKLLDLNDDCLNELFGHLDVVDLSSVTQVCKRFQQLAELFFKKKFSEFDFSTLFADRLISCQVARDVFGNFGHMIKSVTISRLSFNNRDTVGQLEEELLKNIVECCGKTIHMLTLQNFNFTSNSVNELNKLAESLQSLSLVGCVVAVKCVFHLSNFSSLVDLLIADTEDCYALTDVFPALEYFGLDNVTISSNRINRILQNFIVKHKQLKTLELTDCDGISSDVFDSIGRLENLEILFFAGNFIGGSESIEGIQKNILHLGELKNLHRFVWYSDRLSIGNLFSKMVTNKIAMKVLVVGDGIVDDETIKAIKQMKHLEILSIEQTNGLKKQHLVEIVQEVTHLTKLSIWCQENINFDVLIGVLRHTKHLHHLHIRSEKHTWAPSMYNDILDIVKQRENGIKLTITIDTTDVQDLMPQLTIHKNTNWLIIERRPLSAQFFKN